MSLRILIADDHPTVRKSLKRLLESNMKWHVCGEAANGLEAVQKAALLTPDVVILDARMPEMDGFEAASQISSATPAVPILIYTNFAVAPGTKVVGVRQIINKESPQALLSALDALQVHSDTDLRTAEA
jgi:DNA-binding NarL/FixJ family response regulator